MKNRELQPDKSRYSNGSLIDHIKPVSKGGLILGIMFNLLTFIAIATKEII